MMKNSGQSPQVAAALLIRLRDEYLRELDEYMDREEAAFDEQRADA